MPEKSALEQVHGVSEFGGLNLVKTPFDRPTTFANQSSVERGNPAQANTNRAAVSIVATPGRVVFR
jgi:hypothetical protein